MSAPERDPLTQRYQGLLVVLFVWGGGVLAFVASTGLVPKTPLVWVVTIVFGPALWFAANILGEFVFEGIKRVLGQAGVLFFGLGSVVAVIIYSMLSEPEPSWLDLFFHRK